MNFNEISIKVEPEDFSYLEPIAGTVDLGLGSIMGSIKVEVPDIEIKNEPIEDVVVPTPPVKVFACPTCPKEFISLNR